MFNNFVLYHYPLPTFCLTFIRILDIVSEKCNSLGKHFWFQQQFIKKLFWFQCLLVRYRTNSVLFRADLLLCRCNLFCMMGKLKCKTSYFTSLVICKLRSNSFNKSCFGLLQKLDYSLLNFILKLLFFVRHLNQIYLNFSNGFCCNLSHRP